MWLERCLWKHTLTGIPKHPSATLKGHPNGGSKGTHRQSDPHPDRHDDHDDPYHRHRHAVDAEAAGLLPSSLRYLLNSLKVFLLD